MIELNFLKNKVGEVFSATTPNRSKKILMSIRRNRDRLIKYFDVIIQNRLVTDEIMNDKGASFTNITRQGNRITKTALADGRDKMMDEINWYLHFKPLTEKTNSNLPSILDYSFDKNNTYYTMKYYNVPTLRSLIFEHRIPSKEIKKRFTSIISFLIKDIYSDPDTIATPEDYVQKAHFEKLKKRIEQSAKMEPELAPLFKSRYLVINGEKYLNVSAILPAILR
jgi:acetone carboxylase gamma subunit